MLKNNIQEPITFYSKEKEELTILAEVILLLNRVNELLDLLEEDEK